MTIKELCERSKSASRKLALVDVRVKDKALRRMSGALLKKKAFIIKANFKDLRAAKSKGLSPAMLDRLTLSNARIEAMARFLLK